jgi:hypothetical protein
MVETVLHAAKILIAPRGKFHPVAPGGKKDLSSATFPPLGAREDLVCCPAIGEQLKGVRFFCPVQVGLGFQVVRLVIEDIPRTGFRILPEPVQDPPENHIPDSGLDAQLVLPRTGQALPQGIGTLGADQVGL